jgi:hypothetical protein
LVLVGLGLLYQYWETIFPRMQKIFLDFSEKIRALAQGIGKVLKGVFTFDFSLMQEGMGQLLDEAQKSLKGTITAQQSLQSEGLRNQKNSLEQFLGLEKIFQEESLAGQKNYFELRKEQVAGDRQEQAEKKQQWQVVEQELTEQAQKGELAGLKEQARKKEEVKKKSWQKEREQRLLVQEEEREELRHSLAQQEELRHFFQENRQWSLQDFSAKEIQQLREQIKTKEDLVKESRLQAVQEERKRREDFLREEQELGKAYAQINTVKNALVYQETKKSLQVLSDLHQSSSKELKTIGKMSSISMTMMNTYEAAMNVFKGFSTIPLVGQALGMAASAAVVAHGLEQVGRIRAAQKGAYVGQGTKGQDDQLFLLGKHEIVTPAISYDEHINAVVNQRLNQLSLERRLDDDRGVRGGSVQVHLSMNRRAAQLIHAQQVEDKSLGIVE